MNRKLYRFIGFEEFVNLFVNNKDKFVRPVTWDDKYEGYLFSDLETKEGIRNIVREMYYNVCPGNYYAIPDNYFHMWHSRWFTYAQCWSKHAETDAMWRCYSYGGRAVRIRTKEDKLFGHIENIISGQGQMDAYLREVKYDLCGKMLFEQQVKQMKESLSVYETYFHKRKVFIHEGEYRLLITNNMLSFMDTLSSYASKSNIDEQVKNKTDDEIIDYLTEKIFEQKMDWSQIKDNDIKMIDAGDISEYIEGVMVHPAAPQWYVDIVKDICQQKNIKFDGQSTIYTVK